jgi:hypothetical protein
LLRIGVTGHRRFDAVPAARAAVTRVVAALADQYRRPLEVWSALAEGADRLVVDAVLAADPTARLVALLPLAEDDYRTDFTDPASEAEFDRLLASADEVRVVRPSPDDPPELAHDRPAAYLRAGLAMVDRIDVLIALWDGAPARGVGGTADVVAAARQAGREVVVVPVTRTVVAP